MDSNLRCRFIFLLLRFSQCVFSLIAVSNDSGKLCLRCKLASRNVDIYNQPKRFFHEFSNDFHSKFPDSKDAIDFLSKPAIDHSIMQWDDALTLSECQNIIRIFETSEEDHYAGSVFVDGKPVLEKTVKKNTELNVSDLSTTFKWFNVERLLTRTVRKYLNLYQDSNIIFATQQNPLGDEGFRMKRYMNDGLDHHAYHSDSCQDNNQRILAVLIYLNNVDEGGETTFLNQGIQIQPVTGRIAIFPTSFSFVHAGRHPISNSKYVIINFLVI